MLYTKENILALPRRFRANLMNHLSGFKSATLIGTANKNGQTNLGVFNSIVHIGANPPLMGFLMRPHTVERHTLENILETGYYTFNHIHTSFYEKAHQTSAKYDRGTSEFEAVGLEAWYSDKHSAPYVKESVIKIGLAFKQQIPIELNGTSLIIGEIQELIAPENLIAEDGFLDLHKAGTATISGLDAYYETTPLGRLPYARP